MTPATKRILKLTAIGVASFAAVAAVFWYFGWRPVRYVDLARKFTMTFSPEWELRGEGEGAVLRAVCAKGPHGGGPVGVISVNVNEIREIPDSAAFRSWWTGFTSKNFKEFARMGEGIRRIGGLEAPWILYTHLDEVAKVPVQTWQFFFVREMRGYVISCLAKPGEFESFRRDFEAAVDSFQLLE
jgi:hypothetical protein